MAAWKLIEGYKYPYRVSDQGDVQRQFPNGKWRTLKPYENRKQMRVGMWLPDGTLKRVQVAKLVVDYHMGGTPPGKCRAHKNGMYTDNAVENIVFLTRREVGKSVRPGNSRPVMKVDRDGNVVDIYKSQSEAARKNYISQQAVSRRCNGRCEDPYRLDGYNYIFEDNSTGKAGRPRKYGEG